MVVDLHEEEHVFSPDVEHASNEQNMFTQLLVLNASPQSA